MATGRNDPCVCGSGMKFKRCCAGKASKRLSRGLILLISAIAAVAAIGLIPILSSNKKADGPVPSSASPARSAAQTNTPQPGPAPPGKVWSPEHGHWHDAPTRMTLPLGSPGGGPMQSPGSPIQVTTQQQVAPAAQPPGPAPPGKVWSPEHGHWHDAPAQ
ncbi:MAG TPA: SEC-C metal-binding domain-containing protein [Thermoanaerobaculia bacterium]|nr:SEC-C metal-binding domain-containing protein [Thermoanaerobaculia bacterium]